MLSGFRRLQRAIGRTVASLAHSLPISVKAFRRLCDLTKRSASRRLVLQRAGHYGAATIDGIVDESKAATDERFPDIVHNATAWAAALGALISSIDVARVWNEPEYRRGLVNLERDLMPPHPSGEIDLEGTVKTATPGFPGSLVFLLGTFATPMTITVDGEICCSTGDLSCDLTSSNNCQGSDDCPTQTHDCEFA